MNMVLAARLGAHLEWSKKYINADQYWRDLCIRTKWRQDLGPVDTDLSFLVPKPVKPDCPPCPIDVEAALKGQIIQREHVRAYTHWIRDNFNVSAHDPRKYCACCDLMNHPRFMCQHKLKHRDPDAQHLCIICRDAHPTFLCSKARCNLGPGTSDASKQFTMGHTHSARSQSMGATYGGSVGKPSPWRAGSWSQEPTSGVQSTMPHSSWAGWKQESSSQAQEPVPSAQAVGKPKPMASTPLQSIAEGVPGNLWLLDEQTDWTTVNPTASFVRHATEMGHPISTSLRSISCTSYHVDSTSKSTDYVKRQTSHGLY